MMSGTGTSGADSGGRVSPAERVRLLGRLVGHLGRGRGRRLGVGRHRLGDGTGHRHVGDRGGNVRVDGLGRHDTAHPEVGLHRAEQVQLVLALNLRKVLSLLD